MSCKIVFFTLIYVLLSSLTLAAAPEDAPYPIMRDPFKQPELKTPSLIQKEENSAKESTIIDEATKLKLTAILLVGHNSMANINGTILSVGEEIEEYQLMKIMPGHVLLQKNATHLELLLDEK